MIHKKRSISVFLRIFIVTVVFIQLFSFPSRIHAQVQAGSAGLNISPPIFSNIIANPGQVITNTIRVTNVTPSSVSVNMLLKNYMASGENGAVALRDATVADQYSLASWMSVTPENFTLPGNAYKYVTFSINVPLNAEPGGRYASVVASIGSNSGSNGSSIGTELGSLILLTVAGNATVNAQLLTFSATPFTSNGDITFTQRIQDTGNIHIHPAGEIVISDMFGRKVTAIPVEAADVLPGAIRLTSEKYAAGSLLGRYTASLLVNYSGDNGKSKTLSGTTTFWVIPVVNVVIILIVVLLLIVFRKNIFRAFKAFLNK